MATDLPELSTLIRKYREELGISQNILEQRAGLASGYASHIERGDPAYSKPRLKTVRALADGLRLDNERTATLLLAASYPKAAKSIVGEHQEKGVSKQPAHQDRTASKDNKMERAYVLIDALPSETSSVVSALHLEFGNHLEFAAGVFGPTDVVARLQADSTDQLFLHTDLMHTSPRFVHRVNGSNTLMVRRDLPVFRQVIPKGGNFTNLAVVLLRLERNGYPAEEFIDLLTHQFPGQPRRPSSSGPGLHAIEHASIVMGEFDIAISVLYEDDQALKRLVMDELQRMPSRGPRISRTETIVSVHGELSGTELWIKRIS